MNVWFQGILGYSLLISVVMQLLPDKKYEPYVRIFAGIVFLMVLFAPLVDRGIVNVGLEEQITGFLQKEWEGEMEVKVKPVEQVEVNIGEKETKQGADADFGVVWDSAFGSSDSHQ